MTQLNEIVIERKVACGMRDGTTLRGDIYRPKAAGRYPVIVEMVAYELDARLKNYADWYASRGYVFIGMNSRGTYWSEGEWRPFLDDAWGANQDGYDTIEWAGSQPWSNGNVGTMDGSWSGLTQNLLAPTRPPHLKSMFLRMAPASTTALDGIPRTTAMWLFILSQLLTQAQHPSASEKLRGHVAEIEKLLGDPIGTMSILPANKLPFLEEHFPNVNGPMMLSPLDPLTAGTDAISMASEIDVPIFHLGGWYDMFLQHTLAMFTGVSERGFSGSTRESQRLMIGPWVHGPFEPENSRQGDLDFGAQAAIEINEFRKRWFDHFLDGEDNGAADLPRVRLFVMGVNSWRNFESWPPEGATETRLYLGENSLSFDAPTTDSSSTSYDYDPFDPVPSFNGGKGGFQGNGPIDMTGIEDKKTIFSSEPLDESLTVIGPVSLQLYAKSSTKDTDWYVTLTDVHPDGRSIRVCEGSLRARFREGLDREVLMEPGTPYLFNIDLLATAQEFAAGHRIRIAITSSQLPPKERNMNTGGDNAQETEGIVAHNTVLHERDHPSHVVLPVLR
ncbi:MAG: CocE/NonD family hydrolase [Dehalococcoidia bacterium]